MKLNIIKILLFCLFKTLEAQIIFEDFSDGDLSTNPTWNGNISVFTTIGNNTLRSNATAAGTYFLSTSINQISIKGKEWNIQIRQNLASSATNFSRIYLASDNQNLTGSLTGYYLQLGEAGTADVVELFKQNGNIRTSLMRGTTLISTAFNYDIKITNSYTGVWELSMKSVTSINFNPIEASVLDNNNLMFSNIGILTTYTITNRLNFGFDNISLIELPNLIPPQISDLTTTGINSLQITFDKPLKENSVTTTGNYLLNNNLLPTNILFDNLQTINLTFSSTTFLGTNTLTINGISDIQNNLIDQNTVINFSFIPPIIPFFSKYKDLIISEIYADINPTVGIPAVEYLEIYNNTNSTILLQNYTLRDGTTNRIISYPVSILGNNYAIFTNGTSSKNLLESVFPNIHIITLSGFGLTDNGEAQKILNPQGNIIDSLTYSVNWHSNPIKKSGGWSLELVNFTNTCTGNWLSSIDLQGGTPGTQNSVFSTTLLGVAPKIDNYILSTNEIN
ncbi:MAG: lamin tail domain-containing protein, partial [Cytophagales bacterium]